MSVTNNSSSGSKRYLIFDCETNRLVVSLKLHLLKKNLYFHSFLASTSTRFHRVDHLRGEQEQEQLQAH